MTLIFYSVVYMIKRPSTVDEKVAEVHMDIKKYKNTKEEESNNIIFHMYV